MGKVVDEQMREATRLRIIRQAAIEFARLRFDETNSNTITEAFLNQSPNCIVPKKEKLEKLCK